MFIANHYVSKKGGKVREIGLLKEYKVPIGRNKIVLVEFLVNCSDENADWAIFKRCSGTFAHYAHVYPESELPIKTYDKEDLVVFQWACIHLLQKPKDHNGNFTV